MLFPGSFPEVFQLPSAAPASGRDEGKLPAVTPGAPRLPLRSLCGDIPGTHFGIPKPLLQQQLGSSRRGRFGRCCPGLTRFPKPGRGIGARAGVIPAAGVILAVGPRLSRLLAVAFPARIPIKGFKLSPSFRAQSLAAVIFPRPAQEPGICGAGFWGRAPQIPVGFGTSLARSGPGSEEAGDASRGDH